MCDRICEKQKSSYSSVTHARMTNKWESMLLQRIVMIIEQLHVFLHNKHNIVINNGDCVHGVKFIWNEEDERNSYIDLNVNNNTKMCVGVKNVHVLNLWNDVGIYDILVAAVFFM